MIELLKETINMLEGSTEYQAISEILIPVKIMFE